MRKFAALSMLLLLTSEVIAQQPTPQGSVFLEDPQDELSAAARVKVQARRLFEQRKFLELNALADQFRMTGAKTPAGFDKLALFYEGIEEYVRYQTPSLLDRPNERQWQVIFDWVQEWIDTAASPSAYITMAHLRANYAFEWRGVGYAGTVKPERWTPFKQHLEVSKAILVKHKGEASIDPEWYIGMYTLGRNGLLTDKEAAALFVESLSKHKYYFPIYASIAEGLLPKWQGSWDAVETFAAFAADNTGDKYGMSFYARIYQSVNCLCEEMVGSRRDWRKMKQGFEDIQAQWPVQWNLNRYAFYACQEKDKETTRRVIQKITAPRVAAWANNSGFYQGCKAWALGSDSKSGKSD